MKIIYKNILKTGCIGLLGIELLMGCTKSGKNEDYKLPITQSMIDIAENMPGGGGSFLGNVLRKLQAGETVDINAKNSNHNKLTALHYAAELGAPRILQALIDRGADVNTKADDNFLQMTSLGWAAYSNKPSSVKVLLQAPGIDVNPTLHLPGDTADGVTPLMIAASNKMGRALAELLLQDSRTEVNKKSKNGETALAIAQQKELKAKRANKKRYQEIIALLKAKGGTT